MLNGQGNTLENGELPCPLGVDAVRSVRWFPGRGAGAGENFVGDLRAEEDGERPGPDG